MTGEITLTGLVLPIGGVKEKVLAARRADIRRVILPMGNEKDLRELPENVRAEMEFIGVERIEEVELAVRLRDGRAVQVDVARARLARGAARRSDRGVREVIPRTGRIELPHARVDLRARASGVSKSIP